EAAPDRVSPGQGPPSRWSEHVWPDVPPAGFEPAHPPPEGGALSPELRGLRDLKKISRAITRPAKRGRPRPCRAWRIRKARHGQREPAGYENQAATGAASPPSGSAGC